MTIKFKRKNRLLSLLLALVLMFSMIPMTSMTAYAATSGTKDGFSYDFRYGLCKHCNGSHAVSNVIFQSAKVSNNTVTLTFLISFRDLGKCGQVNTPAEYDSSNTSNGHGFTYEITKSFSCTQGFLCGSSSNWGSKEIDFGTTKPQLLFTIKRSAGHNVSTWTSDGNGKHSGYCSLCKQTIPENCSGGTATCKDKAVCSKCNTAYGSVNTNNHSWSEWTTNNGKHTRTCTLNSNHIESGTCYGGTATCTSKAKCTVCRQEYGNVSGHSYQYTADGNVVTETCENNCGHKATATLKVDASKSLVYNGSTIKPLTVEYSDGWAGEKTAKITYADDCITVGKHSGSVTISGATANESFSISQAQNSWTTEPAAEITLGENKWNGFFNSITFGLFFKDTQKVTITAEDKGSGVDKIYYYLSETELTEAQVQDLTDSNWKEYTGEFNINPQDEYIIYAKVVDKANNAKYISSDKTIIIDNIVPVISGIANGKTHYGDTTFTVTDKHIKEVKVDSNPVTLTADGKYTIKADGKEPPLLQPINPVTQVQRLSLW